MRLLFAGTPQAAVPSLARLLNSHHEVVAVLTRPDARAGRGRKLVPSPVRKLADEKGIPVLTPTTLRDDGVQRELAALAPDACPVVAYGKLIPPALLDLPVHGWLNLHFSLLPAWRGAAPVQHALINGDTQTGATIFRLEQGLDTGPIYSAFSTTIDAHESAADLLSRLAADGAELLLDTLNALEVGDPQSIAPKPQPDEGFSLAPKIEVDDARVDWNADAAVIDRLVRGCFPNPGAWTTFRGERVKLDPLRLSSEQVDFGAAELNVTNKRVLVGTGSGAVILGTVRAAGKKPMPAADWARGSRPEAGERFE